MILEIGDKMRFSVELIKQINEMPDRSTQIVRVVDIREDVNGMKTVTLETVRE